MPSLINFPAPVAVAAVTDGGGTETVIATSHGVNPDPLQSVVTVFGMLEITTNGTACTAVVVKIRRGSSASATQVGTTITIGATTSTAYAIPFMATEAPGVGGPMVYSVTVTETGASTHTGTVDAAVIAVIDSTPA